MADDFDNLDDFSFDAGRPTVDGSSFPFSSPAQAVLPSSLPPQHPNDVVPFFAGSFAPDLQTVQPQALFNQGAGPWPVSSSRDSFLPYRASSSSASSAAHPQAFPLRTAGTRSTSDERNASLHSRSSSSFAPLPLHHGTAREKHGQYTPDSDSTPKRDAQPRRLRSHTGDGQSKSPHQMERGNVTTRKRKASLGGLSIASSQKTRSRKNSTAEPSEDLDTDEQSKREHFLERNRQAAHKCRQKKKEWMVGLDERSRALQTENAILHARRTALLNEVFDLKNATFAHSGCRNVLIDRFIESEASKACARVNSFGPEKGGPLNMDDRSKLSTAEGDPKKDSRGNLPRPPR